MADAKPSLARDGTMQVTAKVWHFFMPGLLHILIVKNAHFRRHWNRTVPLFCYWHYWPIFVFFALSSHFVAYLIITFVEGIYIWLERPIQRVDLSVGGHKWSLETPFWQFSKWRRCVQGHVCVQALSCDDVWRCYSQPFDTNSAHDRQLIFLPSFLRLLIVYVTSQLYLRNVFTACGNRKTRDSENERYKYYNSFSFHTVRRCQFLCWVSFSCCVCLRKSTHR